MTREKQAARSLTSLALGICLSVLVLGGRANAADSPWESIAVREQTMIATLPKDRRWMVSLNQQSPHLSGFGESFSLGAGDSLTLTERHGSYTFTPRFAPQPGLQCVAVFRAESFGGGAERKTTFLPAR